MGPMDLGSRAAGAAVAVIDSSGWIAYFTRGPQAPRYAALVSSEDIFTPTVVLYEVYKIVRRQASDDDALIAAGTLKATHLVELDEALALEAAEASLEHGLAMADAIVYATAQSLDATLVTSDADFRDLPGVEYIGPDGSSASGS